jgi:predicted nucleic acid-binding protein
LILLDTSVLSAVLRRRRRGAAEEDLAKRVGALLAQETAVGVPGIVLQEILSGVADRAQGRRILAGVRDGFPIVLATEADHVSAAGLMNEAADRGMALSTPDALVAAQALTRRARLFTVDADFTRVAGFSGLLLFGDSNR